MASIEAKNVPDDQKKTKKKPPSGFADEARDRIRTAKDGLADWRVEARESFGFVSGNNQWDQDDLHILREQRRPPVTFNYCEKMVDAVVGAEVSNRHETTYKPRGIEDNQLAEVWTAASRWVRDQCNAEDEESDAFRDSLICGLGWTRTRVAYDTDHDGSIMIERCDPLEMYYDPASMKRSLIDRRFDFRQWWVNKADVLLEWPDAPDFDHEDDTANGTEVIRRGNRYNSDDIDDHSDDMTIHKDQILITHYETFYREPYYRIAIQGEMQEVEQRDFRELKQYIDAMNIPYVKQHKTVYYHAYFAGDQLLDASISPCQRGFMYQPITAKRDRNANSWYGIVRVMMDPQRWANKWLSQIIHIINTNAKGGLIAETGAFVDPRRAAEEWAKPDSITMLNEGGINRVQQKTPAPYPAGLDRLMDFALNSLPMVTGINLEALGLANREQAGVLEQQRKQAAYGLLSSLFDALRMYRKIHGKVLLHFINNFIADGRIIRIAGPGNEQVVQLIHTKDADAYDVIVEEAPNAPDVKQRTFEALQSTLPAILKAGLPLPPDMIDYLPIPHQLATKWKEMVAQQQQQRQGPSPEQLQKMQQEMQKMQQENLQLKQQMKDKSAEFQLKAAETDAELKLKAKELQANLMMKQVELEATIALERAKIDSSMELNAAKTDAEIRLKSATAALDHTQKIESARLDADTKKQVARISNPDIAEMEDNKASMKSAMETITSLQEQQDKITQLLSNLSNEISSRPTSFTIIRDSNGRPTGIKPAGSQK